MNEKLTQKKKRALTAALLLLALAVIVTVLVCTVDVRAIGPADTAVGLSNLNAFFRDIIGTHPFFYTLTEALGVLSILIGLSFAVIGLIQWIRRKSLRRIDGEIWGLAAVYALLGILYVLFEKVVVNCRPILEAGQTVPEPSFPSSHTLLTVAVLGTAVIEWRHLLKRYPRVRTTVTIVGIVLIAVAVIGRFLSGVHWFTDILAGFLIGSAIVMAYQTFVIGLTQRDKEKKRRRRIAARKK